MGSLWVATSPQALLTTSASVRQSLATFPKIFPNFKLILNIWLPKVPPTVQGSLLTLCEIQVKAQPALSN